MVEVIYTIFLSLQKGAMEKAIASIINRVLKPVYPVSKELFLTF